jgi:membrane protease YdiL (CAAX protease family)
VKNLDRKGLLIPIILWLILTVVYGVTLFAVGNYEVLSFIYHIGLLAVALVCAFKSLKSELGFRTGKIRYGIAIILGFTAVLVVHSFIYGWSKFAFAFDLATFTSVIFAPATEEIFWRGLIQQRMQKTKMEPLGIIITNAALFAVMHVPKLFYFNETPLTFIAILGLGIIFSATFYVTKSTYYSTIIHSIENIFSI